MQIKAYGDVDLSSMSATPTGSDSNLSNPAAWSVRWPTLYSSTQRCRPRLGLLWFILDRVSASDED